MTRTGNSVRPGDWTAAEVAILREQAGKITAQEIGKSLGKSYCSVYHKMRALGLKGVPLRRREWTAEEIARLHIDSQKMTGPQFARTIGASRDQVWRKARELGIKFIDSWVWTPEDVDDLRTLAADHTAQQIATKMGRTYKSVSTKLRDLGIQYVLAKKMTQPARTWTEADIATLRECQAEGVHYEAATRMLDRTHDGVMKKAHELGIYLERTPRYGIDKDQRRVRLRESRAKKPRVQAAKTKTVHINRPAPSRIEWCVCGAPVSNWEAHLGRMGHKGHGRKVA